MATGLMRFRVADARMETLGTLETGHAGRSANVHGMRFGSRISRAHDAPPRKSRRPAA